jgi:hypothetical protein
MENTNNSIESLNEPYITYNSIDSQTTTSSPNPTTKYSVDEQGKGQGTDIIGNIIGFILFLLILVLLIIFIVYAFQSVKDKQPITFYSYIRYLNKIGSEMNKKLYSHKSENSQYHGKEVEHANNSLYNSVDKSPNPIPEPNSNSSSSKEYEPNKSGWCYVGETKEKRVCAQLGKDEKCMSGNIFPSYDLCVNPNLR